ncbi:MAG: SIS domain-containing protein [Thermoplasmata archaeon]|nr:SIS domain-containing protein [Thermoplasmata archaeon]
MASRKRKGVCIAGTPMYQQVVKLPEQIDFALSSLVFNIRQTSKFAVCGMGTCSIAGAFVSDYMDSCGGSAVSVIRGFDLPKWVDSDTTAVVISYSGETKEALHLYRAAVRKGAQVICITSGGELEELCVKDDNILMSMPYGFESRGAIGYMIGYIMVALRNCGLLSDLEDFKSVIPEIKKYRNELIENDENEAREIARFIGNRAPVIYGFFNMRSAVARWKTQFNENSKVLSFYGTMPEFNHNELVGWTADNLTERFVPIMLMDDNVSDMLRCMAETPLSMLMEGGMDVYKHHLRGKTHLENMLRAIIIGDLASLYLADYNHIDAGIRTKK